MNQKTPDRRIQRTRHLLQDALIAIILEKGFEAATVQDVLDRANVGRSTFYAHFHDKEDLLLSSFDHLRTEFEHHLAGQPASEQSPWTLSLSMFQHAQEQRQLYKAMAGRQGGVVSLVHIQKYLFAYLHNHLKQVLLKREKKFPPEILAHHITSAFTSLLTWWLDNDSPYSAEQMNDFYQQLVQPGVEAILMTDGVMP